MANYTRIIPRDLFNEGSLLTLYGRLVILLGETRGHDAGFEQDQVQSFDIMQDDSSGSLTVANLVFTVHGERYRLGRPLNSREKWSLWLTSWDDADFEEIAVFDDDGNLGPDMLALISTSSRADEA